MEEDATPRRTPEMEREELVNHRAKDMRMLNELLESDEAEEAEEVSKAG